MRLNLDYKRPAIRPVGCWISIKRPKASLPPIRSYPIPEIQIDAGHVLKVFFAKEPENSECL